MSRRSLLTLLAVAAVPWLLTALYTVDRAEFAYVTQFGRPVVTRDGATEAGLHVKWPWPVQAVARLDRRLQAFDLAPAEVLTPDLQNRGGRTIDKTIVADAYVCWRVPDAAAADLFLRTVGTPERARDLLGQRVSSRLSSVIGALPLEELIAVADGAAAVQRAERLRQRLLGDGAEDLRRLARAGYGIELVDVRLRRFNYPEKVRPAIAERIASERRRKAAEYDSEGNLRARDIESAAAREAGIALATARADEQRIRKDADITAERIRNDAHAQDRAFFEFLQKLKAYQEMLARTQDTLLLSTRGEFFDHFLKPPRPAAPALRPVPPEGKP